MSEPWLNSFGKSHPILRHRVTLLLRDPRLKGQYGIVSATRSYAAQADLYRRYRAGTFNAKVANPDRDLSTGAGFPYSWKPKGSWHMPQFDGYSHAVDLRRPPHHPRSLARSLVHPILGRYGLRATVSSEWWHVQALTSNGWADGPLPDEEEEDDMITLVDSTSGEGWTAANGKARPLSKVDEWLAGWDGPVRRSPNMRYVISSHYEIVI